MKLQLKKQNLVTLFKLEKGGNLCPLFASISCSSFSVFNMMRLCYYGSLQKKWGMTCTATEDDVDVLMSGYAFRLKILHERALSLLKESMAYTSCMIIDDLNGNAIFEFHLSNLFNMQLGMIKKRGYILPTRSF